MIGKRWKILLIAVGVAAVGSTATPSRAEEGCRGTSLCTEQGIVCTSTACSGTMFCCDYYPCMGPLR